MLELAEAGYENIVCAQPFGCLPNHIVGKGMIHRIKAENERANIVPIDYDPSATKVNQENRIKLMLAVARENLEKKELMASFYKAVDMLPPQKRSICLMKVLEELTNQEIAERMNLSVNTVKTHYTEALKMLRIHLSKMLIIVTFVTLMTYLSVHYLR